MRERGREAGDHTCHCSARRVTQARSVAAPAAVRAGALGLSRPHFSRGASCVYFETGGCLQAVRLTRRMEPTLSVSGSTKRSGGVSGQLPSSWRKRWFPSFISQIVVEIDCLSDGTKCHKGPRVTVTNAPVLRELWSWLGILQTTCRTRVECRPNSDGGCQARSRAPG